MGNMNRLTWILITALLLLTLTVHAETTQEKGLAIAKKIKERDLGWGSSQSEIIMTLRTRNGKEIVRHMRSKSLEVDGDGDKGLFIFDTPLDVKGTSFLSFSHTVGDDDQWIYLPALKRVKRIASKNKSGPFLGSEFAFEDLSSFEVEKFEFDYLGDDILNQQSMVKISMDPVDPYSGYSKANAWVDTENYRVYKIDFYDRRETLLKTLTISDYKLYKNKYWRAEKQNMINHKTGKSTDIVIKNLEFDVGLKDSDFNKNRLKRAR